MLTFWGASQLVEQAVHVEEATPTKPADDSGRN
jgi:hypothetical protein